MIAAAGRQAHRAVEDIDDSADRVTAMLLVEPLLVTEGIVGPSIAIAIRIEMTIAEAIRVIGIRRGEEAEKRMSVGIVAQK